MITHSIFVSFSHFQVTEIGKDVIGLRVSPLQFR